MDAHTYAGLSETQLERYLSSYRELCSKSWRIYAPLFVALFGQFGLYATLFKALGGRPLAPVAFVMAGTSLFVYFLITFCNVPPPVRPRTFGRLILVSITWYVVSTIILVGTGVAGLIPMSSGGLGFTLALWICALAGWLSIPILVRYRRLLSSHDPANER